MAEGLRLYRHIGVCGAGSRFFRVLGERSDAYAVAPMNSVHGVDTGRLLATNDNETGKIGPSPAGCGENPLLLCEESHTAFLLFGL